MISDKEKQSVFFKLLFGQNKGYLCLAFLDRVNKRDMMELWYNYPNDLPQLLVDIDNYGAERHAYFCPQLFSRRERKKEYISLTPNAWSDLDTCNPAKLLIEPSILVESSPNRYQGYWLLDGVVDPKDAEDISRRIAYYHGPDGADKTGWDLTQLLRIPETFNFKYPDNRGLFSVRVELLHIKKSYYRLVDFDEYPRLTDFKYIDAPLPTKDELPEESGEELLSVYKANISPRIIKLFFDQPSDNTWSQKLWQLEQLLFEANFSREQVFVVARDSACNKYKRDGRSPSQLWKEICRAEESHKQKNKLQGEIENLDKFVNLLSAEEEAYVSTLDHSIVERYITLASSLTDAAKQYHQAGAFILLSSILCGSVALPTSHGPLIPNLWFMILADTTLTRKTTSMDIAMDLLVEIDEEAIMATDGSIEGLFSSLALRPKRPSVFLRDEFSGLIESMNKKDYMAGMPEMLTKLYDGKLQRRLLRKEVIEIRDPRLVIFAGGIKNKITGALTVEHIGSGFLPRFIFITAESDVSKIRPMGPPTNKTIKERTELLDELQEIYNHYNGLSAVTLEGTDVVFSQKKSFSAELSDDAWARYNELEFKLVELGVQSNMPEIYTPVGDRLAKSILKAAILLSACRQRPKDATIQVEMRDILLAIKYGEQWRTYSEEVLESVGKNKGEYILDRIVNTIKQRNNEGTARSRIMRMYKLSSREATAIFDTLNGRDLIYGVPRGKQTLYYAYD